MKSDERTGRPATSKSDEDIAKVKTAVYSDASPGQTITKDYYVEVLRRLRAAMRRKRASLFESRGWQLHHDNAPAHRSQLVREFLAKHQIPQVLQPPYSPDLSPCDLFLFPKIKSALKGKRFEDIPAIKGNTTEQLKLVPKALFHKCFQQWQQHWEKCIRSEGDYFEGD